VPQAEATLERASAYATHAEAGVITALGKSITSLVRGDSDATATSVRTLSRVANVGHFDAVITAVRAFPNLAQVAAVDGNCARTLTALLSRTGDVGIGRQAGLEMPRELRRGELLSPREREVYELIVEGRTNKAIAKTLFISESTAKVHVRHIYEKLGVRSRAEAARVWARVNAPN